jgi:PadR family transcriptional regulator PadR
VGGRKRRTYELTSAGQKMLATGKTEWDTFRAVVEGVLRPRGASGQA